MTKPNTRIVQATVWAILARTSGSGDDARNGTGVDAVLGPGDRQGPRATPIFQVFQTQSEARSRISNTSVYQSVFIQCTWARLRRLAVLRAVVLPRRRREFPSREAISCNLARHVRVGLRLGLESVVVVEFVELVVWWCARGLVCWTRT